MYSGVAVIDARACCISRRRWSVLIDACSDNVERTAEQLAANGVEFVQPPKKESWGTSAIFKDVDGKQFVLSSK